MKPIKGRYYMIDPVVTSPRGCKKCVYVYEVAEAAAFAPWGHHVPFGWDQVIQEVDPPFLVGIWWKLFGKPQPRPSKASKS